MKTASTHDGVAGGRASAPLNAKRARRDFHLGPLSSRGLRLVGDRGVSASGQAARRRCSWALGRTALRTRIGGPASEVKARRCAQGFNAGQDRHRAGPGLAGATG